MHNKNGILTLTSYNGLLGSYKEDMLNQMPIFLSGWVNATPWTPVMPPLSE